MQQDLIHYLESSLSRFRTDFTTIEEEIKLVTAYLSIFKVRMRDRLQFKIDVPDGLIKEPIPPMFIQPLVENAIKHGLEPKIEGGKINVNIKTENNKIIIIVSDTGLGMNEDGGIGTGLTKYQPTIELALWRKGKINFSGKHPCGFKSDY